MAGNHPNRTVVVFVEPLKGELRARYRNETHPIAGPVGAEIRAQLGPSTFGLLHFYADTQKHRAMATRLVAIGTHDGAVLVAERGHTPQLASAPMCATFAAWLGLAPGDARYVTLEKAAA